MLDVATIDSITSLSVAPGRKISAGSSDTGACLWAATTSLALQVTSFTETQIAPKFAVTRPGFKDVADIGSRAIGATTTLPGTAIKIASLFVDFGTYGLLFALNSPTASVDQDVQLVEKLK